MGHMTQKPSFPTGLPDQKESVSMPRFTIGDDDFLLDDAPYRVLSGALHYFRVHPDAWADRIHSARLLGLTTIETYVPWNAHEPGRGEWTQSGALDLGRFLDLVHEAGLTAIVRPGPYICAEWDGGGLPAWLFLEPGVGIRSSEPTYLRAVDEYLRRVYEIVAPRQVHAGGPVILVQIENEYGAYGSDTDYLRSLVRITRDAGITVPLTTVDQPTDEMLANGSVEGAHATGSFGTRAVERIATLRRHQPTGPLMCSEFWDGWFDSWGEPHHTTPAAESARELEVLLDAGASVSLYMLHGGTDFGFTNGANHKGTYRPLVTSYDYDAPLDEAGRPTEKFWAFREVIARHAHVPDELPAAGIPACAFEAPFAATATLARVAPLLGDWSAHRTPPTMDALGRYTGFALYSVDIDSPRPLVLATGEVRDRAQVFFRGEPVGVMSRELHETSIVIPAGAGTLSLLVEDQGRINYGPLIGEQKGLIGPVTLGGTELTGWRVLPLNLDDIAIVDAELARADGDPVEAGPLFARATLTLAAPQTLYLDTRRLGKGVAWFNGFSLGRYWSRGPQHTLFVPPEAVRAGENSLVVFEQHALPDPVARFVAAPDLGPTET
ncbi:MAG: bgaB [Microbacteriaceae bacterium]|nr:bgaB [Microbacteriaceae bacterium]